MPKFVRTFGIATIAGLALTAGLASGAQASGYEHHDDDHDARVEVRVEKRLDDDRAEFKFRKKIEHGDVRIEVRVEKRVDDEKYGHHAEARFEKRVEIRH